MSKIPHVDSIEELARFWDTHDVTEFEDELEEVEGPVFDSENQTVVRIRLRPKQAQALKRLARSSGVGEADLVREWISEKLRAL